MLPNKPPGVQRVNDRRVLNGSFWALRSGAPWRDADWIRELTRQQGAWANIPPKQIAKTRSASARSCIPRAIWHSSNSHQSEFGYALMSPRPGADGVDQRP